MNRRIKKKRFKMYHKQFCHPSWHYKMGLVKRPKDQLDPYQCPKCCWDSLDADEDLELGRILWWYNGYEGSSFEIEYKCPVCGTVFSYEDGD